MNLAISKTAVLLKNEDEIDPRHPEVDYILCDSRRRIVLELGDFEAQVWKLLVEYRDPAEIVARMSAQTHKFEHDRVMKLIRSWIEKGILLDKKHRSQRLKNFWYRLIWWEVPVPAAKGLIETLGKVVNPVIFNPIISTCLIGAAVGVIVVAMLANVEGIQLSGKAYLFSFAPLALLSLIVHELGHALAMVKVGSALTKVGFALYFGLPVFFVDTSTVWAKSKWKRVLTAASGMYLNLLMAGLAGIFVMAGYNAALAMEVIWINLFIIVFSLIPFVKMDGYYVLIDLLGVPALDVIATREIWNLRRSKSPNWKLIGFALASYIVGGIFVIYSIAYWITVIKTVLT